MRRQEWHFDVLAVSCNIVQLSLRGFSEFGAATATSVARFQDSGRNGNKAFLHSYPRGRHSAVSTQFDASFA